MRVSRSRTRLTTDRPASGPEGAGGVHSSVGAGQASLLSGARQVISESFERNIWRYKCVVLQKKVNPRNSSNSPKNWRVFHG